MKKYMYLLAAVVATAVVFWSCSGENNPSDPDPDPVTLTCKITTPLDSTGYFAGDTIRVTADANDTDGVIKQVRFILDGTGISADDVYPYTTKIPSNTLLVGSHSINAIAENEAGKEVTDTIFFGIKPKNPTNLTVTQLNVYTFSLAWADNSTGEEGFKIERKIDTGTYEQIATTTEKTYIDSTINKKGYSKVYYQVRAYKEIYNSDYVSNFATIGFPAPSDLSIIPTSVTNATLTWKDNSIGEDRFEIERKLSTETEYTKIAEVTGSDAATQTWENTALDPTKIYDYKVKAVKGGNSTGYTTSSGYIPFKAPSNLNVAQVSITSATITWTDNSIGEEKFDIERKLSTETNYLKIGEVAGSETTSKSWNDIALEPTKSYDYRIKAVKDTYSSAYVIKNGYTNAFPAPSNLIVTQISITSATLTWTDNSIGEEKFEIERKLSTESVYIKVAVVTGNDTTIKTYTDSTLEPIKIYDYRIKAVHGSNSSTVTTTNGYETMQSPTNMVATVLTSSTIKLDWIDKINGEDGYIIDRKVGAAGTWTMDYVSLGSNVTTYIDTGLSTSKTYYYRVRAYYSIFYSNYSNEVEMNMFSVSFISIPTGSFSMGSTTIFNQRPVHTVSISRPYYLGKYEVTQKEWSDILGSNPSHAYGVGDDNPVYYVGWYTILVYCNKRSIAEGLTPCYTINGSTDPTVWGSIPTSPDSTWDAVNCNFTAKGYRLPTEAEWEYAARFNDGRMYPWGNDSPNSNLCNYSNYVGSTTIVGNYPLGNSSLGLCDMAGNIFEWVWDWYGLYSSTAQIDPTGPISGTKRVLRGCSWETVDYFNLGCTYRYEYGPYYGYNDYGFRLARTK